jgi:hypothetical protein
MGGIGVYIKIAKTGEQPAAPLAELHKHVWEVVSNHATSWLTKVGNRVTLDDYFGSSAYDGLESDEANWDATDTQLGFWFRDMAGCCNLSAEASLHWVKLGFARWADWGLGKLALPGWKIIAPERSLAEELRFGMRWPLVYLRKGMFAIVPRKRGAPLEREDTEAGFGDSRQVQWSELSGKDRDIAEWAALTRLCQCDLCLRYRKTDTPPKQRYKPLDYLDAAREAWDLLDGAGKKLEKTAAAALHTWDWSKPGGPPAMEVLADWLAERDARLPSDALAGMLNARAAD